MAMLCKALTKSAGIGLSITAVCKNAVIDKLVLALKTDALQNVAI